MFFVYLMGVYSSSIRTGIIMTLVLCYTGFPYLVSHWSSRVACVNVIKIHCIYSLLSILGYTYNGIPISAYFADFTNQLLPTVFYFVALDNSTVSKKFYKYYVLALFVTIVVGSYFYILMPSYYVDYITRTSDSNFDGTASIGSIIRFASVYSSTIMGSLAVFCSIISLYRIVRCQYETTTEKWLYYISFPASAIAVFLTNQRSAMVCLLASIAVILFFTLRKQWRLNFQFMIVFSIFVFAAYSNYGSILSEYYDMFSGRIESSSGAFDERSIFIQNTLENSPNILFGTGLGSVGHKAAGFTKYYIYDGGIFKVLAEYGIIGFVIYVIAVLRNLKSGFRNISNLLPEYLIVFVCLAQSIGSNTICFQAILPIFWFSLGTIFKLSYNNKWK